MCHVERYRNLQKFLRNSRPTTHCLWANDHTAMLPNHLPFHQYDFILLLFFLIEFTNKIKGKLLLSNNEKNINFIYWLVNIISNKNCLLSFPIFDAWFCCKLTWQHRHDHSSDTSLKYEKITAPWGRQQIHNFRTQGKMQVCSHISVYWALFGGASRNQTWR